MEDQQDNYGNCKFYKCSLVAAEKLYRKIFGFDEKEKISKSEILAVQHMLQSINYFNDYVNLKQSPFDPDYNNKILHDRVEIFM